jgi:hypothetical protein
MAGQATQPAVLRLVLAQPAWYEGVYDTWFLVTMVCRHEYIDASVVTAKLLAGALVGGELQSLDSQSAGKRFLSIGRVFACRYAIMWLQCNALRAGCHKHVAGCLQLFSTQVLQPCKVLTFSEVLTGLRLAG